MLKELRGSLLVLAAPLASCHVAVDPSWSLAGIRIAGTWYSPALSQWEPLNGVWRMPDGCLRTSQRECSHTYIYGVFETTVSDATFLFVDSGGPGPTLGLGPTLIGCQHCLGANSILAGLDALILFCRDSEYAMIKMRQTTVRV